MSHPEGSIDTGVLQLQSLELDIKTLQRYREEDKKEFQDFQFMVNKNFVTMQQNFDKIQDNFKHLLLLPEQGDVPDEQSAQGSVQHKQPLLQSPPNAPGRPKQLLANTPPSVAMQEKEAQAVIGTTVLRDPAGKELNLDGTPKIPYRHPNFAVNRAVAPQQVPPPHQHPIQLEDHSLEEWPEGGDRGRRPDSPFNNRRNVLTVKPAKLNISEFSGTDPESWIQNLEQYFAAARTPLEHRTELAVSYLQGPAIQWWRGTGFSPQNVPWHRFCTYIADRFSIDSACDIVNSFHAISQTSTVAVYVEQFEQLVNCMRRENPAIPNDYYVTSFLSGLNPYIRSHVECFKPPDMQTAVWYARRMEKATATAQSKPYYPQPKRQVVFEPAKPPLAATTQNRNTIIQQAKQNQVCYKCREPWVPDHRQVCKMSQKAQVQALQATEEENAEIIYVTDFEDPDLEQMVPPSDNAVLQVSLHAAMGIGAMKNTFILTVNVGKTVATALVDSGSTSTFVSPDMAAKLPVAPTPNSKIKVLVASGGELWSEFTSRNCPYEIQGTKLHDTFRVLKLKGYDMILGVDWLKKYSPVLMDFIKMEMRINVTPQTQVTFVDETVPLSSPMEATDNAEKLMDQAVCGFFSLIYLSYYDFCYCSSNSRGTPRDNSTV